MTLKKTQLCARLRRATEMLVVLRQALALREPHCTGEK